MKNFFLTLHMVSMCLVVGTLFLQSLTVVFRLRLKSAEEREGLRKTQKRINKFIYYPILFVTIVSGIYLAIKTGVFDEGQWIYAKMGLLLVLVALGIQNGRQIKQDQLPKKYAMMVHIAIFIIAGGMIYLATVKPF
ncbi:MAG: SirB2 family protein [Nitrospinae bacterium]|nr:SirB2 family protein [Nitrospinota bacterium]